MNSGSTPCEIEGCPGGSEVRITRALLEGTVRDRHYCSQHAEGALRDFECECVDPLSSRSLRVDSCAVRVESVICDAREGSSCLIGLREIDGLRFLAIPTGRFEAWMLDWELRHEPTPVIGTHQAMVRVVHALQGELQKVSIVDVSPGPVYQCHAHIIQRGIERLVEMRASDAVILAVICNTPIMVESQLWESLRSC